MNGLRRVVALLLLALTCAGCATFESGDMPGLDRWPAMAAAAPAEPRSVRVELEGLPDKFVRGWRRGAERVLEDAGYRVVEAGAPADRRLLLTFEHTRQNLWVSRIWMGVCALTATVVPARTVQYFEIDAALLDGAGTELGRMHRSVDGQTWVGILTLFVLPFAGPGLGELVQDSTRSLVVEARDGGWL